MTKLRIIVAILIGALALVETANALIAPHRVATVDDWHAAAAEVRAELRDGDLIVFAPAWSDQIGRMHLGDRMPLDMVGRWDAARYGRIWEVSTRGAHAPETASAKLVRSTEHGRVTVALYEKSPATVSWDSTSHALDSRVTEAPLHGNESTACLRDGDGFRCPGSRVEVRTMEIDYQPRRGLLVPLEQGRATNVDWDEVPLGGTLAIFGGLHDYYARKSADGGVDMNVLVDGKSVGALHLTNGGGVQSLTVTTTPGKHSVRVELSAKNAAWRNAGFHLEARS